MSGGGGNALRLNSALPELLTKLSALQANTELGSQPGSSSAQTGGRRREAAASPPRASDAPSLPFATQAPGGSRVPNGSVACSWPRTKEGASKGQRAKGKGGKSSYKTNTCPWVGGALPGPLHLGNQPQGWALPARDLRRL